MRRFACLVLIAWLTLSRFASAQSVSVPLVQPAHLPRPEAGSVSGSLASWFAGAGAMTRGSATLLLPVELPEERGRCLAPILPSYSADAGASEWGLGWDVSLRIHRVHLAGHLDYTSDDFVSPWGRLVRGTGGDYYPQGLAARVRIRETARGMEAVDEAGTRFVFAHHEDTARGTYAYWLTQVQGLRGEHASLSYVVNASGRPYLDVVTYGSAGFPAGQRVRFEREALTAPVDSYASGALRRLDQRVARVIVESRAHAAAPYRERYRYTLAHDRGFGPAPRLRTLVRGWPDGSQEPEVRYAYGDARAFLKGAVLSAVTGLEPVLTAYGTSAISPSKSALFDVDDDGVPDLEHAREQTLARHTDEGWTLEPLPAETPASEALALCRPTGGNSNPVRRLAWLVAEGTIPQVVFTRATSTGTRIVVCDRDGSTVRHDAELAGDWTLGKQTYLVDINGDRRADLVRVGATQIQTLLAAGDPLTFKPGPTTTIPRFQLANLAFQDVNGDGLVDLAARTTGTIHAWYGTGQGAFASEPASWLVVGRSGRLTDLSLYAQTYTDLDGDGLCDLILTRNASVYLFENDGLQFRELVVDSLSGRVLDGIEPLVADLRGQGDPEVNVTRAASVWSLPLRASDTGLLTQIDDGRGARVDFGYARGPRSAGQGARTRVVSSVTRSAVGRGTWSSLYTYEAPVLHGVGRFLLGFTRVRREESWGTELAQFRHLDDVPSVLESVRETNQDAPEVVRFERSTFDDVRSFGVRWLRPRTVERGYMLSDETQSMVETEEFVRYERELCPVQTVRHSAWGTLERTLGLSSPAQLADALHCLEGREQWVARHANAERDVDMTRHVDRDARGAITDVSWDQTGAPRLTAEHVGYDELGRVHTLRAPSGALRVVGYDERSGLMDRVVEPSGVALQVAEFDAQSLAPRSIHTERGAVTRAEGFAFDAWERLARSWDDASGTSEEEPSSRLEYTLGTHEAPGYTVRHTQVGHGSIRTTAHVVDAAGETMAEVARHDGQWAYREIAERDAGTRERWVRHAGVSRPSLGELMALFATGSPVAHARHDGFDQLVEQTTLLQENTTRVVRGHGALSVEGWVSTLEEGAVSTHSVRDAAGRVTVLEDETRQRTRFEYDALGRLVWVELPDGTHHERRFDELGRVSRLVRDGVGSVQFAYDPRTGLLATRAYFDRDGAPVRTETLGYDGADRVTSVQTRAGGDARVITFTYDGAESGAKGQLGFRTGEHSAEFVRTIRYGSDGKVRETLESLPEFRALRSEYAYTANGDPARVTRTVLHGDDVLETTTRVYGYDADGRLGTLDLNGKRVATVRYDELGRVDHLELESGKGLIPFYDPATGRSTGVAFDQGAFVAEARFELNERGQVTRELSQLGSDEVWTSYGYTDRGELQEATRPGQTCHYAYDLAGRPRVAVDARGTRTIRTGDREGSGDGLRYDRAGRLVERWGTSFHYGPHGYVSEAENGSLRAEYAYDAGGERVLMRVDGTPREAYLSGGVLTAAGFSEPLRVAGHLLGVVSSGTLVLAPTDLRGTPFATPAGARDQASPYGVRRDDDARSGVLDFAGQGFDPVLGAVRMGVRDYDPLLGAFHTPDPALMVDPELCLTRPLECNLYGYAAGNPVAHVDPQGKWAVLIVVGGIVLRELLTPDPLNAPGQDNRVDLSPAGETQLLQAFDMAKAGVNGVRSVLRKRPTNLMSMAEELPEAAKNKRGAAASAAPKLLTEGAYRAEQFASQKLFDSHFAKHAAEWGAGNITKAGYLKRAQDLLGREVGGDILGAVRANGDVLRYNVRTNEFAVGTADGAIRTLFRPEKGMQYWLKQVGP